MEKYRLVAQRLLELSDTCLEALEHIQKGLNEGNVESTAYLFADVVEAVHSMDEALKPFLPRLTYADRLESYMLAIWNTIESMVDFYEHRNDLGLVFHLEDKLLPDYKLWKDQIDKVLQPYTVC
ncbi:hypothetical protein CVV65_14685 [Kyrpidia spormannii]|uniref:DUF8042 domain-containing protein n=1 Tax=Kyrpidia spormannii TaxID=2055160 RepID=A0A2K8N9K6_9BACL|nr:hypothetical protein [Kyrpidia spormannii]ATY86019.1 hypothetical protein CVV65_14685 [Kyrpidia spormannii]